MNASQPILVSIKSNWETIAESPVVGKDVLELLSSAMYVNPLSIYREYIQNAADAIEEAIALGLLNRHEPGRVDITIDAENRIVRLRDNGTGIPRATFTKVLIALGASRKRGTKSRGFRGVGRLAGLGYCRELVFRSQADGENEICEMRWDCQRLKSILRDPIFKGDVESVVKEVVRIHPVAARSGAHFFEVELRGIVRHGDDKLMNAESIAAYLAQVAPVPFAPTFKFADEINNRLLQDIGVGTIHIYMNGATEPLFRPHRDAFEVRKGAVDTFTGVKFVDITGDDDKLAAKGWYLDHGYLGAIDAAGSIKGLRLRSGNIQVGDNDVVEDLFTESRFNGWVVGEIHVLDERILPNGRRDHFEQNVHFTNLRSQLRPHAVELSRQCRNSSVRRNVMKSFVSLSESVSHNLSVVSQGAIQSSDRKRIKTDTIELLQRIEKLSRHSMLRPAEYKTISRWLSRSRKRLAKLDHRDENKVLGRMSPHDKALISRVLSILYDLSPNKPSTKRLIDQLLCKI